jgi:Arc/MetJ-type ribon-helix-helix transcriptional regulator
MSALNDYRELVLPSPVGQTADSAWTKLLQWRACAEAAITELVNECGVRANRESELRATIRRLEGTSQAQEGFFHAAMDRAVNAEAELAVARKDVDELMMDRNKAEAENARLRADIDYTSLDAAIVREERLEAELDALDVKYVTVQHELAALKAENERLRCCGNCQYRRTGSLGERCSISGWLVVPHAHCQLTPSQWETRP